VLQVHAFVQLVLEGFVDAHDVRRFAEYYVASVSAGFFSLVGNEFENMENEAKHAVLFGDSDQIFGLNVVSAEDLVDLFGELVDDLIDVELFPQGFILLEQSIDELVDGDVVIEVKVLLDEDDCLFVGFTLVLEGLLLLEEPSPQNG
jgi:hypothetical protein